MMSEWKGQYEDWRIDWATYGGPYIRYPAWPHPENGHDIARLSFADPTPFEEKRKRASLIAAAPAMYEALLAAEGHLQEMLADPKWHPIGDCPVLRLVQRTLAKARGET